SQYLSQRARHTYELAQRFVENAQRNSASRAYDERQATMLEYQHYIWAEIASLVDKLQARYADPSEGSGEQAASARMTRPPWADRLPILVEFEIGNVADVFVRTQSLGGLRLRAGAHHREEPVFPRDQTDRSRLMRREQHLRPTHCHPVLEEFRDAPRPQQRR